MQSETDNLLARGMSHRDVLEKNFDTETIKHVALMESEAETMVVITNEKFEVLKASNEVNDDMKQLILMGNFVDYSHHGMTIESEWKREPFLATVSPIRTDNNIKGYVFMFLKTQPIRDMIHNLSMEFFIVGVLAFVISIIATIFLSKFITGPLIQMKKATEKLSKGESDVMLDTYREDELGELSRSIQKLSDDLDQLKKERTEFLSSISHELRTPLTYLKGYADVLNRPNLSVKEREEFITIIQEEASNVNTLVKDLFDLARMDQNEFIIRKEQVECCEFLQEIVLRLKPAFEEKGVSLHCFCKKSIFITIDRIRFGQVIHNFLDNALKYSRSDTHVQIKVLKENQQIRIQISDQGDGIPKSDLPRIWDRLYRVDKSRSRATGGSGLGLTIAKEIIEKHGGEVHVKSVLGKGTTFSIYMPIEGL
ncbi:sensor histidine kinase [Chengkuizengella marina]|uniref:sensor histidine kinase n=1 Tax=Chengkuizengella marina TaxID=2507566 RepID=UPI002E29BC7E|nr:ATP-binding protein [Chengkuizengella marina]